MGKQAKVKTEEVTKPSVQKDDANKTVPEQGVPTALFVMSIIALVLCIVPFVGLIFAIIALVLLVMTLVKLSKKQIVLAKKGKLIVCAVLVAVSLFFGIGMTVTVITSGQSEKEKVEQEYTSLKEVDVNGLTVKDACTKVREAGWTIYEVAGNNTYATKSDCSDEKNKVVKAYYHKEKYYSFGDERSDYEKVTLYFADEADKNEEKKPETNSGSSNTGSSNNAGTSSSPKPANSTQSSGSTSNTSSASPTTSQKNALRSAKDYLEFSAFSREGLIAQLEFEKYSHADAVYAADNCGANWNEQAARSAKQYLDYSAFSRDGLIDQLIFEKFTREQAIYGVNAVGL